MWKIFISWLASGLNKQFGGLLLVFMKKGLASSAGLDVPREIAWYADVRGFDPTVWQHSFMGIGHVIISSAILPLLLFRVGLVVN